ncbi:MAG: hypothetical protein ACFFCD_11315, partial [Promethearchaeota archaeon]
ETFTTKLELERVRYTSTYKANLTKEDLDRLLADKLINEHQYAQLLEIIKIKKEIADLEREEEHLEAMVEAANVEQERLRENIKALGNSEEEVKLRKNYVNKLSGQEAEIEKLVNRRAEIRKKLIELNKKLSKQVKVIP